VKNREAVGEIKDIKRSKSRRTAARKIKERLESRGRGG